MIMKISAALERTGLLPVIGVDDFGQLTTHACSHCFRCCRASYRAFANGTLIVIERLRGVINQLLVGVNPVRFAVWTASSKGVGLIVVGKFGLCGWANQSETDKCETAEHTIEERHGVSLQRFKK